MVLTLTFQHAHTYNYVCADSRITTDTHLVISSSVEHSNSSNSTTTAGALPSPNRASGSTANGATANGNVHLYANTRNIMPFYVNRERITNGQIRASSVGRTVDREVPPGRRYAVRRMRDRVWSTGALHNSRVNVATGSQASVVSSQGPPRTRSYSSQLSHHVKERSLSSAPEPPPRSRSNSTTVVATSAQLSRGSPKRVLNRYSAIEMPSDYGKGELSKQLKSHSVHVLTSTAVNRESRKLIDDESHDYADPDHPSDGEHDCLLERNYDMLTTHMQPKVSHEGVDVYPEDFVDGTPPPPLPPKAIGSAIYQDPEITGSREDLELPNIIYGYVPTVVSR